MPFRFTGFFLLIFLIRPASAQDSIQAAASHRYEHPSIIEHLILGKNYRPVWAMPVSVKIIRLESEKGGLIIQKEGGGMQTRSLHLEDGEGHQWMLRSIDKTVDKAMEAVGVKNKSIRKMSQRMISVAHPYGSLTITPMAEALGIVSTDPVLRYVADDSAFGEHLSAYAGAMYLLEHREPALHDGDKVVGTKKMLKALGEDKTCRLDQQMLLQARLLDMLIGDWDRHADQWKWEFHRLTDSLTVVYPVPRDHDQAYFNSTGLLFNMMRLFNVRMFVGFRNRMKLKALNYKSWSFDKQLLKDLGENDWRTGIQTFQSKLGDSLLAAAVRRLPPEIYALSGTRMYRRLLIRRDRMLKDGMRYRHFLQAHPGKVAKQERKEKRNAERAKAVKDED
jgi:hypothetical protein